MKNKNLKGFTLIELLIVIGIIAILAGIVLVAVNPAQQFGKANDSERKSEIGTILSAVYQFQTSPSARGALPTCSVNGTPGVAIPECGVANAGALQLGTTVDVNHFDCSDSLIPSYLRELPIDPSGTPNYDAGDTGYYLCQDTSQPVSRVYVLAPGVEVFDTDGGCTMDKPLDNPDGGVVPVMCVSG